jgi:hypothetical protein
MDPMKKPLFNYFVCISTVSAIALSGCNSDEPVAVGEPSEIYFESQSVIVNEGEGTVSLNVTLDKAQNVRTIVNFKVEGNAVSSLQSLRQADYELITEPPLIIPAGETTAAIEFRILEDEVFEQEIEKIVFTMDAVLEGNAELTNNPRSLTHTYEIQENDYRLFLEWENPEDEALDMNLYVEMPNKALLASENTDGFEELTIVNIRENEQYYVDIWYQDGEVETEYTLQCLRAGENAKRVLVKGHFNALNSRNERGEKATELINNHLLVKAGRDLKAF